MKRRVLSVCAVAAVLSGCFDDRFVGGSLETENSVAARLLPIDSLLDPQTSSCGRTSIVTVRLDRWNFPFAASSSDGHDIRVETSQGAALPFRIVFWDSTAAIARLQVRLDSAVCASAKDVRLRWGLGQQKPRSDSAATWQGYSASQQLVLTSVLVDDFEDGNDTTLFPLYLPWRSGLSTNATLSVSIGASGHGRSGKALQALFAADSPSYVLVGVPFGGRPRTFRSLDSIVFQARGKGTFAVALEHLNGFYGPKTWKVFELDTIWRRYSIRPVDFAPADGIGRNLGWDRVKDSVTDLTFFGRDGSEFQLDNVLLHGVNAGDLR